ncbi:MAG: LuxR C-terminal-related transcriptional regulator [Pseudomonadales bacterium]
MPACCDRCDAQGKSYRSPDVRQRLGLDLAATVQPTLTPRELEVLHLLAAGLSSRAIAGQLAISDLTVKKHRENMARKFGVHSAVELTRAAQRLGLLRVEGGAD